MRRIAVALALAWFAVPGVAQAVDPHASSVYLFEAPQSEADGARMFYGNIAWTDAVNDGRHELVGKGQIGGRDIAISLTIGRNTDPAAPAGLIVSIVASKDGATKAGFVDLHDVAVTSNPLDDFGTQLIGAASPASGNSLVFVGSGDKADAEKNAGLLQQVGWLQLDVREAEGPTGQLLLRLTPETQAAMKQVLGTNP